MALPLRLFAVGDQGTAMLGALERSGVFIGREPDGDGFKVNNGAVSRNHGTFLTLGGHWFYKDLGSTNGSWVNGQQVKEGEMKLIRPGSVIQLADSVIRVEGDRAKAGMSANAGATVGNRSLLVFSRGELQGEYPVPEYGKALVVGGSQADITIEGDIYELPSLVFERRGDKICAYRIVKDIPASLNGQPVTELVNLKDGDAMVISDYTILFNDPNESVQDFSFGKVSSWGQEGASGPAIGNAEFSLTGSPAHKSGANRITFGQFGNIDQAEAEETLAIDPAEMERRLAGADMHPSMRYSLPSQGFGFGTSEDKLLIIIGGLLFVLLVGLVVWWFWI